jgi:hypothetical protein
VGPGRATVILVFRRAIGGLALLASVGFALQAWVASDAELVENTVRNNVDLNAEFLAASHLVDDFYEQHHRFPVEADVRSVSQDGKLIFQYGMLRTQADVNEIPSGANVAFYAIDSDAASFPKEVLAEFGAPPDSAAHPYLLVDSRYDIPKIWASWARRSNAKIDPMKFYVLGSSRADTALFGVSAVVLAGVGVLLWRQLNRTPEIR